ncbi:MAG: alpha-L-glutamate ligase-like protein [Myxococcota bacterium]
MLRTLHDLGLLGINRRNAEYTLRWNDRRFYPRVDDKLLTKGLCREAGVPTARLLAVARTQADVGPLLRALEGEPAFALKPARGSMGNGILLVRERVEGRMRRAGGGWVDAEDLRYHASGILSGLYSLGGQNDAAFAEECLEIHPEFRTIASDGVPDVRVVVHRGIPVMAMTRLPTLASRGRANLHQGAVGAGIDLATGRTTHAVVRSTSTRRHPDTGELVVDRLLPDWDRALEIAVRATDETELGYVGADVVVDARQGALILELNARPGLAIQVANRAGLLPRLEQVEERWRPGLSVGERLEIGREIGGSVV